MNQHVENTINQAEKWLKEPMDSTIEKSINLSDALLEKLREVIQNQPDSSKLIGPLIGKVRSTQNSLNSLEHINWVALENGSVSIGHRPATKLVTDLRLYQTTHVLTLLSEKEGSEKIKSLVVKNGLGWLWFPMESAKPPAEERHNELAALFSEIKSILSENGKIYIHCSAGIHRTGMISYALIRYLGYSSDNSLSLLAQLRDKTSEGVGIERIEWAESVADELRDLSK